MTDRLTSSGSGKTSLAALCIEVSPLLIGVTILLMGIGLQGTLIGVRASIEGFSILVTGIVMAAYYVGYLGGAYYVPVLIRKVGHVRTFAALGAISSAAVLLYGVFPEAMVWMAIRFILGVCFAGLYVVAESWLNDRAPNNMRGQLLSVYIVVHLAGLTAGQYLLVLADPQSMTLFVLISVLVSLAVVPCTLSSGPAPDVVELENMPLREVAASSPIGAWVVTINGLISGIIYGIGAVYAREIGLSLVQVSSFIAAFVLGGAFLQWPIGWISDRVNRRGLIIVLSIAGTNAAILVAIVSAGDLTGFIFAAMFLVGGVIMPQYSLGVSLVNDRLPPSKMVAASSSLVFLYGLGAAAGPLAGSFLMKLFGTGALFYGVALLSLTIAVVGGVRIVLAGQPAYDAHRAYHYNAPRGTSVAQAATAGEAAQNQFEEEK